MAEDQQESFDARASEGELRRLIDVATSTVVPGSLYRHRRTGAYYHVRLVALNEADAEPVVVYGNAARTLVWVRPLTEFTDGRFEHVE